MMFKHVVFFPHESISRFKLSWSTEPIKPFIGTVQRNVVFSFYYIHADVVFHSVEVKSV